MKITPKLEYVSGSFDTDNCEMVSVSRYKYKTVNLCIRSENGFLVPLAEIKLYDSELYVDADATFEDAKAFGEEIAKRWNKQTNKTITQ